MGCIPGKGSEAWAGLFGVIPAKGEIMIPPVSVCHHVSTSGHFPFLYDRDTNAKLLH
jgi:hypothetical protein